MMKSNLFAGQGREAKLTMLGDALQVLERHADFEAMAASGDKATPRARWKTAISHRGDGADYPSATSNSSLKRPR